MTSHKTICLAAAATSIAIPFRSEVVFGSDPLRMGSWLGFLVFVNGTCTSTQESEQGTVVMQANEPRGTSEIHGRGSQNAETKS